MQNKVKENPMNENLDKSQSREEHFIVLHNDEVNTFDYVIETLVKVCEHNSVQAEQCAHIVHFKGKCEVKKGTYEYLKPKKDELINKGLNATIE
ncbi:MAG TPA: hypothetical protein DDX39_11110 [Bacteroidales bacterium]|nr:MAG: Clp protease ClpS [Bacteroidetes bacterium GWF2_33_38]OFY73729.1 MAG: Clp protease ClpS [Bacteroidetes bacterium RIFOXYA12_FULL_33_9]HBF89180.1 hypothetical protein [Bacteroidales bacterium]